MNLKMCRFCGRINHRELYRRLDEIIELLKDTNKKPSLGKRVTGGLATGIGIASIVSIIEIVRGWIGG